MARPERWRLDAAGYPHHAAIQTRFQDLDVLGHINNVAWAALFEAGRVKFNHAIGLMHRRETRWLVANVEINYLAEGHFPDDVDIATGIGTIGTRSWQILAAAFQGGKPLATCDVTIVMSNETGLSTLPEDFRADLGKWMVHTPRSS
jgi:acyl-CoA thioester hydrolase